MKKNTGFTLIEVLIMAAIIAIVAVMFAARIFNQDNDDKLVENQQQMQAIIELSRNYALSGYESNGRYGYGVFVRLSGPQQDNRRYFIYSDDDDNKRFQTTNDTIIQEYNLNENIFINDCTPGPSNNCDIFFTMFEAVPYAEGQIGGPGGFTEYLMELHHQDVGVAPESISINGLTGKVE